MKTNRAQKEQEKTKNIHKEATQAQKKSKKNAKKKSGSNHRKTMRSKEKQRKVAPTYIERKAITIGN